MNGGYRLLSVEDLAERWGLTVPRVLEVVRLRPDLPAIDFTGFRPGCKKKGEAASGTRVLRFRPEDLAAWEAKAAAETVPAPAPAPASPPAQAPAGAMERDPDFEEAYDLLSSRGRRAGPRGRRPPAAHTPR